MGIQLRVPPNATLKPELAGLIKEASKVMPVTADMVILIAKRVEELSKGANPMISVVPGQGPTQTALLELIARKIGPGSQEDSATRKLREILDEVVAERFPSLAGKG